MLVFDEVKSLVAVVPEAGVAGEKGKTLCYGVGYDDMVAWVPMFLLLIKMQARVCVAYMTTHVSSINRVIVPPLFVAPACLCSCNSRVETSVRGLLLR